MHTYIKLMSTSDGFTYCWMEFKQFILESYKSIALHFDHTTLYNTALKFLNMHFHFSTIGSIENKYCGLIKALLQLKISTWSMSEV